MIGFKEEYTAEEALKFYMNREFYTVIDGQTAITENGAVASAGLKSLSENYCEMKGDVALFEAKEENKKLRDMIGNYKSLYEFTHANFERVVAERDQLEYRLEQDDRIIGALKAERDAAFAMSRCECESNEACKNLVALHDEVERLKQERDAALAEVKRLQFQQEQYGSDKLAIQKQAWLEADRARQITEQREQITTLKSVLCEAKETLGAFFNRFPESKLTQETIATINEALK